MEYLLEAVTELFIHEGFGYSEAKKKKKIVILLFSIGLFGSRFLIAIRFSVFIILFDAIFDLLALFHDCYLFLQLLPPVHMFRHKCVFLRQSVQKSSRPS